MEKAFKFRLVPTEEQEIDAISLQQSLRDLDKAYKNFFKGSGFPKFKSKHNHNLIKNL